MTAMTESHTFTTADPTYRFVASRLGEAEHKIDLANRRLARNGITERFTYITAEWLKDVVDANGITGGRKIKMVTLTLSAPRIALAGWSFVATLVHEQAGVIARVAPGQSLNGWEPRTETTCDHCHTNRGRKDTYVVRNADGDVRQVGRNCLASFLGIAPAGLWALEYSFEIPEGHDEELGGGSYRDTLIDVREVIAAALAASNEGRAFVPKSSYSGTPTAGIVSDMLWGSPKRQAELADVAAAAAAMDPALVEEVLASARAVDGDSDYARNLRIVAAGDHIDERNMALLISSIGAWNRARNVEVERATAPVKAAGFIAEVGAKITGLPVTVSAVPHQMEGEWGWTTLLTFATEDGHEVKWFASGLRDLTQGDKVVITSATVKAHDNYKGTDQTVITRAKLAPAA